MDARELRQNAQTAFFQAFLATCDLKNAFFREIGIARSPNSTGVQTLILQAFMSYPSGDESEPVLGQLGTTIYRMSFKEDKTFQANVSLADFESIAVALGREVPPFAVSGTYRVEGNVIRRDTADGRRLMASYVVDGDVLVLEEGYKKVWRMHRVKDE